jgi:TonB family protein
MREAVSAVIAERARAGDGMGRVLGLSFGAHVAVVAALVLMPAGWWTQDSPALPKDAMFISLGGTPGPRSTGMTPIDARPIQQAVPEPELKKPQWVQPPAVKTPEMTVPEKARPAPRAKTPPVTKAPDTARGHVTTKGTEARSGTARAETGATRGTGFGGLTTGGGGGTGGYVEAGNFCCPDYLGTMVSMISQNWNQFQQVAGETLMKFTIQRDGRITDVEVERSSGFVALDLAAQRALIATGQLPALPAAYPDPDLVVHLSFQYKR